MIFLYFAIFVTLLITVRLFDNIYRQYLMRKFLQNGRKLSPVSRRILERWKEDYNRLSNLITEIDTTKLDATDKKNLALGVESLNFFYQTIEPTIGTGVRRYKTRISNLLQNSSKIIIEISKKARTAQ